MSLNGPRTLTTSPCECGDSMRWEKHGLFRPRWRMECICGRSGPWRRHPVSEYARPLVKAGPLIAAHEAQTTQGPKIKPLWIGGFRE